MPYLKQIKKLFTSFILLFTLLSFSGLVSGSSSPDKTNTELVYSVNSKQLYRTAHYKPIIKCFQNILFNQYSVFTFKHLLNNQLSRYTITLKSQTETWLHYLGPKHLEQNLIATIYHPDYQDFII